MTDLGTDMAQKTTVPQALTIGAIVLACGAAASLLLGAFVGTRVFPCSSCHAMNEYAQTGDEALHGSVACTACHSGDSLGGSLDLRARVLVEMLPGMLRGTTQPQGPTAVVSRDACLRCHAQVMEGTTSGSGIAINHTTCAETGACVSCHGGVAHADIVRWPRMYSMEQCVNCHKGSGAPDLCDACHLGKSESDRLAVGPWQVTHGSNWRETHGMGSVQYCSTCHPSNYCVDCHGTPLPHPANWGSRHGIDAKVDREACATCHPDEVLCDGCHGMQMPHPDGFLEGHSDIATGVDEEACAPCHLAEDCIECHENHIHPGGPNMPQAPSASSDGER